MLSSASRARRAFRPPSARDFAADQGLSTSSDLEKALADPAIDAWVSCGPAQLHAEHTLRALEAGKPVLAVKPMALAHKDALRLLDAAEQRGLLLALGYNRSFTPNVEAMRRELASGALGRLLHAEGDFCVHRYHRFTGDGWKADPDCSPPGGLADHALYLAIETMGPMASAYALARTDVTDNRLADATAVLLRTRAGGSVSLTAIGATANYFRFQVFGEKGWAELREDRVFRLETVDGRKTEETLPEIDAERAEIEAFADALSGVRPFPTPARDAVHSVAALEAIARAANEGAIVNIG